MTGRVSTAMRRAGIAVQDYRRGPLGVNNFAIAIQPSARTGGIIRIWEGAADIEVHGDKRYRQAVLNVQENRRIITRRMRFWGGDNPGVEQRSELAVMQFRREVLLPGRVRYEVTELKPADDRPNCVHFTAFVKATVQGQKQTLLVGMDETHHFISAMPEEVKSVREAHRSLRPPRLGSTALRQGEWFFVPVTDALNDRLHRMMGQGRFNNGQQRLGGTSHIASNVLRYRGNNYAIGFIREMRRERHRPLWLPRWHRVVRNRELVQPAPQTRRQERSRTWD